MHLCRDLKPRKIKIRRFPIGTVAQLERASARLTEVLGSNPIECHMFYLLRHVFSPVLPWRSVEMSNFYWGLHIK